MKNRLADDMREEYDFSKGIRGAYANRAEAGTNLVLLEPDVYEVFRDSKSVNDALRKLIKADLLPSKQDVQPSKKSA